MLITPQLAYEYLEDCTTEELFQFELYFSFFVVDEYDIETIEELITWRYEEMALNN